VIVTGKGGTGKTTVAATLARAAHAAGRRVLAAEMGECRDLVAQLAPELPARSYPEVELRPGLDWVSIEPFEALAEYLGLQLRSPGLARRALAVGGLHQLLEGAPGWRELITLGKVWHLEQQRDDDGRPRYDCIVVDAPATGHGLTFLDVPRTVRTAVRSGPLRRNAGHVEDLMRDPTRTRLLPVALAEELPASETAELVERLRRDIGVTVDRVVVNALLDDPLPGAPDDVLERLAAAGAAPLGEQLPGPAELAACLEHLRSRHQLQQHYREVIETRTELPSVPLPYVPAGPTDPEGAAILAERLLAPLPAAEAP